jgi:hypothetical protein
MTGTGTRSRPPARDFRLPAQDFSAARYSENIETAPARFVNSCLDFFSLFC